MKLKLLGVLFGLAFLPVAAFADTSIYFCEETGAYGASWGQADNHGVAKSQCEKYGGTACEELISCGTGFAAIATSNNQVIGASCGAGNQGAANKAALDACRDSGGTGCAIKHKWKG
ncbi:MAG TPA: hypothetical protein DEA96_11855 [Leptospiraceae bacterium]|nr:hypothetical protein [Spirochaetaceae bacterium]HBS05653.1 hypothetical protein [Leptospiraceae bacterium]|tara:strand:+ start:15122 stop:15472 length:351 start_codon:yes stop_codon:yes gene_type:complete